MICFLKCGMGKFEGRFTSKKLEQSAQYFFLLEKPSVFGRDLTESFRTNQKEETDPSKRIAFICSISPSICSLECTGEGYTNEQSSFPSLSESKTAIDGPTPWIDAQPM